MAIETMRSIMKERRENMRELQSSGATGEGDLAWCALYTRHQHEKTVAEMLSAKGLEVFLPLYSSLRTWKDRKKMLSLPLFPCYVFVRGGLNHRLQVVSTPGVHMILCNGDHVAVIPEAQIEAIRKTVEGKLRVEPHPFLKCGERVRVRRGVLEGVEGLLVRKKNQYRLVLCVDSLAQSVAVEVDASDVEPAGDLGISGTIEAERFAVARSAPQRWPIYG
jgi:transcription antitermination factor NusG